jgi:hypothetical protein
MVVLTLVNDCNIGPFDFLKKKMRQTKQQTTQKLMNELKTFNFPTWNIKNKEYTYLGVDGCYEYFPFDNAKVYLYFSDMTGYCYYNNRLMVVNTLWQMIEFIDDFPKIEEAYIYTKMIRKVFGHHLFLTFCKYYAFFKQGRIYRAKKFSGELYDEHFITTEHPFFILDPTQISPLIELATNKEEFIRAMKKHVEKRYKNRKIKDEIIAYYNGL